MTQQIITNHAIERYQVHFAGSTKAELSKAFDRATLLDQNLALTLVSRSKHSSNTSQYYLSDDHGGMFVVDDNVLITYLRFCLTQRQLADKLFGKKSRSFEHHIEPANILNLVRKDPDRYIMTFDESVTKNICGLFGGKKGIKNEIIDAPLINWESEFNFTVSITSGTRVFHMNVFCENTEARNIEFTITRVLPLMRVE